MGDTEGMKTTIEVPDELFRDAKSAAARRGQTLRQFLTEAIADRLRVLESDAAGQPWMRHFGSAASYSEELRRLEEIIDRDLESVDTQDWE
jgi:hypothetical protein